MNNDFGFQQLIELCQRTHQEMQIQAGRTVDTFLVIRNWLFGWYIVEYEQSGADRAEYGSQFLMTLSKRLQHIGIRGSSPTRLKLYRAFYQQYRQIDPALSEQLAILLPVSSQQGFRPTASDQSRPGHDGRHEIQQTVSVTSLSLQVGGASLSQDTIARRMENGE